MTASTARTSQDPPSGQTPDDGTESPHPFRTMPHNIDAEKSLLGAFFVNNRAYEMVSEFLRPEHFAFAQHGSIFEACAKLIERGQIADPVTLRRYFEADENLADIGGPAYLQDLAASAVTVINAGEYGHLIHDLFLKRELIALGEDVVNSAYGGEVDESATTQIENAEQGLYDLATAGEYEGGFQAFKDSVIAAIDIATVAHNREGGLAGVGTGFRDLDSLLGGLHSSDLLILAGRPGMGKTALATNIAYNAAYTYQHSEGREGAVVGFFSLEMSAEQLASRILSEQSDISSDRMRKGELANEEFNRLSAASTTLHQIPIFIDDTPALTVSALRTRARRLKRQHNLGLIVVDYLQLISGAGTNRNDGRVQEVSEITRGLKTLAKELNVPVLALSQLSRAVEQREPPRPQLSDLRESGSIEQDADVVMFIHREDRDYTVEEWDQQFPGKIYPKNIAEIIVAKHRNGPIGTMKLIFRDNLVRFDSMVSTENF